MLTKRYILCVCESWCELGTLDLFNSTDMQTILSPAVRTNKHGRAMGGLFVAYNPDIFKAEIVTVSTSFIFVKFIYFNFNFILGVVYLSPVNDFVASF